MCVCVCVWVGACVRACVRVCVRERERRDVVGVETLHSVVDFCFVLNFKISYNGCHKINSMTTLLSSIASVLSTPLHSAWIVANVRYNDTN